MKKWKAIGIASILLGLSAILSNPAFATHVQLTRYTYSDHGDGFREYLSIMANRFETQTGISVEFVISSGGFDGYRSKLLTMVAGGVAPDVTDAHPVLAAPLLTKDLFEDLMPYVKRDKLSLEQRIPPVAIRGVTAPDGTLWGLPYSVYPVVTFFNADLFSEAGLPNPRELGERWTWETLTSSAKSLTRDKDGDGIMETIGTERISSRWEMQVHQAGGQLYDSIVYPNRSQFNSPEVLRAVEFIQGLYAENMAVTNAAYRTWKGNVGFNVVDGPTVIGLYYQDVPFS
jgi:ABC-type glycerol-3-phosphate transport system substrate-binding protein